MREPASETAGGRRGIARADDRDRLFVDQVEVALRHHQRRRVLKLHEQSRIESLPQRQIFRAELLHLRNLTLRVVAAEQARRRTATAPRQVGYSGKRRRSAT